MSERPIVPGCSVLPDGTAAYYGARWKQALALAGCVVFVAVAAGMLNASGARYQTVYVRTVMIVGIAFFSLCGVVGLVQWFVGGPRLVITGREVFTTSPFGRPKTAVPLEEIEHIVLCRAVHNRYMAVVLKEDAPMMLAGRWSFTVESNRAILGCPAVLSVPQVLLRTPVDEVARELASRCGRPVIELRGV